MERLTERFDDGIRVVTADGQSKEESKIIWDAIEKLADYEDAEEEGRLIMFPVAVGDRVYEVCGNNGIIHRTVKGYLVDKDATYIAVGDGTSLNEKNMGKTFFRTLEEAEAKLKEMEGDNANT